MDWDPTSLGSSAAAVVMAFAFLRYLQVQRESQDKLEVARMSQLKSLTDDTHKHSEKREERMLEMLGRNINSMDRSVESHGKILQALTLLTESSPAFIDRLQVALLKLEQQLGEVSQGIHDDRAQLTAVLVQLKHDHEGHAQSRLDREDFTQSRKGGG